MAASFLQKFLKKPLRSPPLRILTTFENPNLLNPQHSRFLPQNPSAVPIPNPNPNKVPIFPSFPHCFSLEPIYVDGLDRSEGDDDGGEGTVVWADSVKKKRKRKMNKHKLKKLRKRLRRKT